MARLFRVISFNEEIHGECTLRMLREIKDTDTYLKESFQSETSIAGVAYENFIQLAEEKGDTVSLMIFFNASFIATLNHALNQVQGLRFQGLMRCRNPWSGLIDKFGMTFFSLY